MKALVFLLCCLPLAAMAQPARVNAVSVGSHKGYTRVTLDLSGRVRHKIFTLKSPHRVVLDIADTRLGARLPSGKGLIEDFRSGRHGKKLRIVFDLNAAGVPRSFFIPARDGHAARLVVDVYGRHDAVAKPVAVTKKSKAANPRDVVIAVDAGHGGFDPGAHGPDGLLEKDVTLAISKKLAALIDAIPGMRAVLTRKDDRYLKLRQRIAIARADHADMFISIHCNSAHSSRAYGGAVYALSRHGATSEAARWLAHRENSADKVGGVSLGGKSKMLASVLLDLSQTATISASLKVGRDVLDQMSGFEPLHNRNVEQAAFVVLKSPDIPSILVETAFISNAHEEHLLGSRGFQEHLATAILGGVVNYYRDHAPPGTLIARRGDAFGVHRYVINSGDTLSGIADRFNVDLRTLEAVNGLDSSVIHTGQVLKIPAG
jgi:N-acetylmuramoyl-L-alanine amidase